MDESKTEIMECYTLWTTDPWLKWSSFKLEGIASSLEKAIESAKSKQLLTSSNHVVIYCGHIDDYENTYKKVFSTEFDKDRKKLED